MMTTTLQSLVDDTRRMLDVAAQGGYTDVQLALYAIDGVRRMYAVRPSSRYANGVIDDQEFPPAPPPPLPDSASAQDKAARNAEIAEKTAALLSFEVRINEPRWRRGVVYHAAGCAHDVGVTDRSTSSLRKRSRSRGKRYFFRKQHKENTP